MKARCHNPNAPDYHNYGARGITVCKRWRNSFKAFIRDMGPRPGPEYTIEREDNDGNYTPSNCRWATRFEQENNKHSNCKLCHLGKTQTVAQWARELSIPPHTIYHRLSLGMSTSEVLNPSHSSPHTKFFRRHDTLEADGISKTVAEWAALLGMHPNTIIRRLQLGWSAADAVSRPSAKKKL